MRRFLPALILVVAGLTAPPPSAQQVTYRVPMDQGQVVPDSGSGAVGNATVILDPQTRRVTVSGTYSGLSSNATAAHIHGPAGIGANGSQIFNISGTGGTSGSFSGTTTLSVGQVQDMQAGRHYLDLHTQNFPGGELRGQILQFANEDCPAALPSDPLLEDNGGSTSFGPNIGDPSEPFNVTLGCSNASAAGIYAIVIRLGKNASPASSGLGDLWISGPKLLTSGGGHSRNRVAFFASPLTLPNDISLAGIAYTMQGFCNDPANAPGRLSNAITQVVGIGSPDTFQDDFNGNSLDPSWSVYNGAFLQQSVSGGELHMNPTQSGSTFTWFENDEGTQIYRAVSGDFTATATLRVEDPGSPGQAPPTSFRLGGLVARDPASSPGNRNSIHVALGAGDSGTPVAAEDKTTSGSVSDFQLHPISQTSGQVRIRRVGSVFSLEYRAPAAGNFQVLRTHTRTDLPATLNVGPMVYSNDSTTEIILHIDEISIVQ